jgi:RNA polymerase sigma-70 factor, ECF subfamily
VESQNLAAVLLSENVTAWLVRWNNGDEAALEALTPMVYAEMHRLAAGYLRNERNHHTFQATALVHEAYLQLRDLDRIEWKSKAHFIGIAAQVMRRILVAHARTRNARKRGGLQDHFPLQAFDFPAISPAVDLTVLDQALDRFAKEYPRQARVVELRFFGGLTAEEIAEVVGGPGSEVSSRTVERDWRFARAWLHKMMTAEPGVRKSQ